LSVVFKFIVLSLRAAAPEAQLPDGSEGVVRVAE
jgi:hypothetical protein